MRILIYVEPHPIRNTQTHFKDIAQRFLRLLPGTLEFDVRLFANAATFAALDPQLLKKLERSLIRTTTRSPVRRFSTDAHESKGSVLWAAVKAP